MKKTLKKVSNNKEKKEKHNRTKYKKDRNSILDQ